MKSGPDHSGRRFSGVRLDLEMTGNANVRLTFSTATKSATYQLQTGTAITAAQSGEADYDTTQPYMASSKVSTAQTRQLAQEDAASAASWKQTRWTTRGGSPGMFLVPRCM